MSSVLIRPSREDDLALISALEKASDAPFRLAGMDGVADSPAPDPRSYADAHHSGRLLTAVTPDNLLIGFIRIEILDNGPHLEQVSVHPDHQGRGVGSALLQAAEHWARSQQYTRMTLTTFRDVSWNGPYYARRGWVRLLDDELGPELAAARQHERDLGLDRWPRVAMAKDLGSERPKARHRDGLTGPAGSRRQRSAGRVWPGRG